jgi:hypothetical protein
VEGKTLYQNVIRQNTFVFSGCLLTYLVMKELKKNNGKMKWGMFYFHRFWRYGIEQTNREIPL